ncbi:MAG TPA: hypothetical protein VJ623_13080 [Holophagaceae bacterium]|nr:hypothetical protein [Holophagaceae bacterium]
MRGLGAFIAYDALSSGITTTIAIFGRNNHWFANFDELLTFTWLLVLFRAWTDSALARKTYVGLAASGLLWTALGLYASGSLFTFNDVFLTAQSLILGGAAMFELACLLMREDMDAPLTATPRFWVYSGLFLFYMASIPIHALGNHLLHTLPRDLVLYPWLVRALFFLLYKLMVAKAFLCPLANSSSSSS